MNRLAGWPAVLADGPVTLRPFRMRDASAWSEVRLANEAWLAPWEPVLPGSWAERHSVAGFAPLLRALRRQCRDGTTMPFAVLYSGRFAGQITVANIIRGSFNSAALGYWVDGRLAGRGICPTAVALVVDHCFTSGRLHRLEANVRPENLPSRRVVEKLGFRVEGQHERFLLIDGAYRDHTGFAITAEEVPEGLLRRWESVRNR